MIIIYAIAHLNIKKKQLMFHQFQTLDLRKSSVQITPAPSQYGNGQVPLQYGTRVFSGY